MLLAALAVVNFAACSSTSNLAEDEILYAGMKQIQYVENNTIATTADGRNVTPEILSYYDLVKDEVEAALDCAPSGAFLGSSYFVSPLPIRLWIYNKYANSTSGFGKWMRNSFGAEPVLMNTVNPEVRALVAKNVLRNNGFFNADVDYFTIPQKNPKKEKLQYTVTPGRLYVIDTLKHVGFPPYVDSLIRTDDNVELKLLRGAPFSIEQLDKERTRISNFLRNRGYYYYNPAYSTFLADSVSTPGMVEVRLGPVADMPAEAMKQWYLGKMNIVIRKSNYEPLTDTLSHRFFSMAFSGKKPPLRPGVILRDIKLRPRQLFSQEKFEESVSVLNSMGLFSMANFTFAPRDTTAACDTLDMILNCTLDKPYDVAVEANYKLKSNDRTGPGMLLELTRRNVFRGGEKLSLSLRGSYEWQTGKNVDGSSSTINSYEYGGSVKLEYPRIEAPFNMFRRHRFYAPPSTLISVSGDVLNRADFFKMLTVGGALTYKFRTSKFSDHEFSPFLLDYNYLYSTTAKFDSIVEANPAIYVSMRNQFVPKMKYTYSYRQSPLTHRHPITWETTITESGNALSLAYMASGKKFNAKQKDLFGNPFAQFLKVNSNFRKSWTLNRKSQLVGRVALGVLWAYGNSERAPYMEQFYVGGANSLRAFTIRSIGPGKYVAPSTTYSYLDQTGDVKFEMNLEYRFNLTGSLNGAVFLDAGNVWLMREDKDRPDAEFCFDSFYKQLATGTGLGIRYDMDFIVLRFDVGVALHVPYETGKSGYYNIPKFSDGLGYHFAIGYPF